MRSIGNGIHHCTFSPSTRIPRSCLSSKERRRLRAEEGDDPFHVMTIYTHFMALLLRQCTAFFTGLFLFLFDQDCLDSPPFLLTTDLDYWLLILTVYVWWGFWNHQQVTISFSGWLMWWSVCPVISNDRPDPWWVRSDPIAVAGAAGLICNVWVRSLLSKSARSGSVWVVKRTVQTGTTTDDDHHRRSIWPCQTGIWEVWGIRSEEDGGGCEAARGELSRGDDEMFSGDHPEQPYRCGKSRLFYLLKCINIHTSPIPSHSIHLIPSNSIHSPMIKNLPLPTTSFMAAGNLSQWYHGSYNNRTLLKWKQCKKIIHCSSIINNWSSIKVRNAALVVWFEGKNERRNEWRNW